MTTAVEYESEGPGRTVFMNQERGTRFGGYFHGSQNLVLFLSARQSLPIRRVRCPRVAVSLLARFVKGQDV